MRIRQELIVVLVLLALPWVFANTSRPLVGQSNIFNTSRIEQYFSNRPRVKNDYIKAAQAIRSKGCSHIGLYMGGDDWEYPLWVLLKEDKNDGARLEHVTVRNVSALKSSEHPFNNFDPCAVILTFPRFLVYQECEGYSVLFRP